MNYFNQIHKKTSLNLAFAACLIAAASANAQTNATETNSATATNSAVVSKLPPAADKKNVTFAEDIQPIFKESCFACHSGERARGSVRLDSLEATLKSGKGNPVVVTNNAEKSKLMLAVARVKGQSAMPPSKALPVEKVALIRAWIEQGAK